MKGRRSPWRMKCFPLSAITAGHPGCDWIVTGEENEDLLIFQIEMHAQNSHNLVIDEGGKEKIRKLDHAGSAR